MRISEAMSTELHLVPPDDTVQQAAELIADIDANAVLVGAESRVSGILTVRDIVIRLVARGLDPATTPVRAIMSSELFTCGPDDAAEAVVAEMERRQIEQMPVLAADGTVSGMVWLADLLRAGVSPAEPPVSDPPVKPAA